VKFSLAKEEFTLSWTAATAFGSSVRKSVGAIALTVAPINSR